MSYVSHYNCANLIGELARRLPRLPDMNVLTKPVPGIFSEDRPLLYLIIKKDSEIIFRVDASDPDLVELGGLVESHPLFSDFKRAFFREGGTDEASELLNKMLHGVPQMLRI